MNSDDFGAGIFDVEPPDNHTCEWIEGYYGYTCRTCGAFIAHGSEPWLDGDPEFDDSEVWDEDESSEPIGSCEDCDCDVFEDDACCDDEGSLLCGHCAWFAMGCPERMTAFDLRKAAFSLTRKRNVKAN